MRNRSPNIDTVSLRNDNYKSDVHYALQMPKWLLKYIGMWPLVYGRSSKLQLLMGFILLTAALSSMLFILLPCGHFIFVVDTRMQTKVDLIGPVGFCVSTFIKFCYLGLRADIFKRCMRHLERDWKLVEDSSHRIIMLKNAKISRRMITTCAIFLFSGTMSFHTVMQVLSIDRNDNSTFKPLAYPGLDAFFNARVSPTYEILFLIHCYAAMVMCTISTAAYSMAAIFVTHICGQIQIQIARLEDLVEQMKKKNYDRDPFYIIVQNHVDILRLAVDFEVAMREISLTEIAESIANLCMLEYYWLTEWRKNNLVPMITCGVLIISFTFKIYIFCYIGEILTGQCSQIGVVSYEIEWYNLPTKRAHDLILLILISQFPPKLTAGSIINLSFETFSTVVKTSIVYLNLIRTVTIW